MRRFYMTMVLVFFLQACSGIPLSQPTNIPLPTEAATLIFTPSVIPTTTITPSITPSPTIVHFPTQDPNLSTVTVAPISIFSGQNTITPVAKATSIGPGPGFISVEISERKIFWGNCIPNKSKVIAKVDDPKYVASVVIFVQVKSAKEEDYTPWTTGDVMFNNRDGTFTYILQASEIEGHNNYRNSWVRMQLVAINDAGLEVGRTKIFTDVAAMSPCMCLEPLKGCPIETPVKP